MARSRVLVLVLGAAVVAALAPFQLQLFNCSHANAYQNWTFLPRNGSGQGAIVLSSAPSSDPLCITANASSGTAVTAPCVFPVPCNQSWEPRAVNASFEYASACGDGCLNVDANRVTAGADIVVFPCNGELNELFSPPSAAPSPLVGLQSGLCLDAGSSLRTCGSPPFSELPFCDTALGVPARVAALVENLTLA